MKSTGTLPMLRLAWLLAFSLSLVYTHASAHKVHDAAEAEANSAVADKHFRSTDDDHHIISAHIRAFRMTGDDDHLDKAWLLLGPMLEDEHVDAATLIDAATVAQAQHRFEFALSLIERALATGRDQDRAWLLKASIHLVRGDADAANKACARLCRVRALIIITCRARAAIAAGHSARVLPRLRTVIDRTVEADQETLAWALSVAGDAAISVDLPQSVHFYRRSLALSESTQVRSALVDVLLRLGRLDDAQTALDLGSRALPLELRRWIVALRLGHRHTLKQEISDADHQFRHWLATEDWLHAREMARFYLDVIERPDLARRLARINLSNQREPEDIRLACRVSLGSACVD